jgi:hypothetical protein
LSPSFADGKAPFPEELISVDSCPWNNVYHSSALDFMARNAAFKAQTSSCLEMVLTNYVGLPPQNHVVVRLLQKAAAIGQAMRAESPIGVMYGICIPKKLLDDEKNNFVWRSHSAGRPCQALGHPATGSHRKQLLESTQKSTGAEYCPTCLDSNGNQAIIHYRILTAHMGRPEVHTYAVSTLIKARRQHYRLQMKLLAQEAYFYAGLNNLREKDDGRYLMQRYLAFEGQLDQASVDYLVAERQQFLPDNTIQTISPNIWQALQQQRASAVVASAPAPGGPSIPAPPADSTEAELFYSQLEGLQSTPTEREIGDLIDAYHTLKDQLDRQRLRDIVARNSAYLGEVLPDMLLSP